MKNKLGFPLAPAVLLFGLGVSIVCWQLGQRELRSASRYAASLLGDESRLISIEPMPEVNGPACEWEPAAAASTLNHAANIDPTIVPRVPLPRNRLVTVITA